LEIEEGSERRLKGPALPLRSRPFAFPVENKEKPNGSAGDEVDYDFSCFLVEIII
jgi:hypothetical protein